MSQYAVGRACVVYSIYWPGISEDSVFYVWIMYNIAGLEYIIERAHSLSLTVAGRTHTTHTAHTCAQGAASFCVSRCLIVFGCVCVPSVRTECVQRVATRVVQDLQTVQASPLASAPNFAPTQRDTDSGWRHAPPRSPAAARGALLSAAAAVGGPACRRAAQQRAPRHRLITAQGAG